MDYRNRDRMEFRLFQDGQTLRSSAKFLSFRIAGDSPGMVREVHILVVLCVSISLQRR